MRTILSVVLASALVAAGCGSDFPEAVCGAISADECEERCEIPSVTRWTFIACRDAPCDCGGESCDRGQNCCYCRR